MVTLKRSGLVWPLLLCLVLANGFMVAPGVAHAAHHASHHAGTHATSLCAWLCAAGQGIETSPVSPVAIFHLIDHVEYSGTDQFERHFSSLIFLRGPPAFSS